MGLISRFLALPAVDLLRSRYRRYRFARSYYTDKLDNIRRWVFNSREVANFTYHLEPRNQAYLAAFVANVTGQGLSTISSYLEELETDEQLRAHVRALVSDGPRRFNADPEARYGRRLGWYALARALKPRVIVETGVDQGLGSLVLTSALMRNAQEGYPGRYYGTDIDPNAGYMLTAPYNQWGQILYGDSIQSLKQFNQPIDLFINDSDHSAGYERDEYQLIQHQLSPHGVIIGDNAHATSELFDFARQTGRQFLFFQENPRDHWYPGAGIGLAFPRRAAA
jgi:predicted O-methyltransferase YrrM